MGNNTNEKGFQPRVVEAAHYLMLTHKDTHMHNPTNGPSASNVSVHRQTGFFSAGQSQLKSPSNVLGPVHLDNQEKDRESEEMERGIKVV